ncbi:MAG: DEAD/DEAH box helicase [Planctomycetes bacterium]|nr:DEAD/DEAH box helicase [Planctomycetota bacterium]
MRTRVRWFRFPEPVIPEGHKGNATSTPHVLTPKPPGSARTGTKTEPLGDALPLRDRVFYTLQPPVQTWLADRAIHLPAKPFAYQAHGISFLVSHTSALLGDEMGLGKTMQAAIALRMMLGSGQVARVLLVCPKSLVTNWVREFRTWTGDVPTLVVEGSTRRRHALWELTHMPVKIVNYELLARDADFIIEKRQEFDLVVLDEAQRIKNEHSQTARAARSLARRRSWALTGTPLENSPEDLISIFKFLEPGLIRSNPSLSELREATQPYILRRLKDQVLDQLPPKVVRDTQIDLTAAQRETYEAAERDGVLRLNELGDAISIQNVFELVLRLKQICNFDPATGESAKVDQLGTDMEEIAASGRKALIFSQWVNTLRRLSVELKDYHPLEFHGGLSANERNRVVEEFRSNPDRHALLLSYGAGSVGLNLQFAQYVFLFDRWWNPAVEDQAINRVHRIGQTEPVVITRFQTTGTIEERIIEVLDHKRAIMNEVVPGTAPVRGHGLSEEDIFRLFDIRVRPRRAAA